MEGEATQRRGEKQKKGATGKDREKGDTWLLSAVALITAKRSTCRLLCESPTQAPEAVPNARADSLLSAVNGTAPTCCPHLQDENVHCFRVRGVLCVVWGLGFRGWGLLCRTCR
jgi:hypothetical protein